MTDSWKKVQGRCQCRGCYEPVVISGSRRYCSVTCRDKENRRRRMGKLTEEEIKASVGNRKTSTVSKGAIGEMQVSIDLIKQGYDVFKSSNNTGACDLVAVKRKSRTPNKRPKMYRIEVTKGVRKEGVYKGGGIRWRYAPHDPNKYDVLALYTEDSDIYYDVVYLGKDGKPVKSLNKGRL